MANEKTGVRGAAAASAQFIKAVQDSLGTEISETDLRKFLPFIEAERAMGSSAQETIQKLKERLPAPA